MSSNDRPLNVLFLMSDEHRPDVTGYEGDPVVRTTPWHERYQNETVSQCRGKHLMIKRDALKYQWYGEDGPEVLFDLGADPGETRNFIDDAAYAEAVTLFRERRGGLGFGPNADPEYRNAGYGAVADHAV